MSAGKKLWNWCRIPPEQPRNSHRKLVAGGLLCTIFGLSLFASLAAFYNVGPMVESTGVHIISRNILPVVNVGEGASYLGNVTLQSMTAANNSTMPDYYVRLRSINGNDSEILKVVDESAYSSGDLGQICLNITNFGDADLHVVNMNIYDGITLFASMPAPFTIPANSIIALSFDVSNINKLSCIQAQELTQINQQRNHEKVPSIMYTLKLETAEGVVSTVDSFNFPTYPALFLESNSFSTFNMEV